MRNKILVLFLLCVSARAVFSTAYNTTGSGNWSATATWTTGACGGAAAAAVPGSGDTATICAGHTVTLTDNRTIGTSGATGTNALVVAGTGGVLTINAGNTLTMQGDLTYNQGTTLNINGNITFDPPAASTYRIKQDAASGSGTPTINITGVPGTEVVITTDARGGGNFFFDDNGHAEPSTTWTYFQVSNCGSASQNCVAFTLDQAGSGANWSHGQFLTTGAINYTPHSGTNLLWDTLDFRNCLDTGSARCVLISSGSTPTTSLFTNITAYSSTPKQFAIFIPSAQVGKSIARGDASNVPGFYGYNVELDFGSNHNGRIVRSSFWVMDAGAPNDALNTDGLTSTTAQDSVTYTNINNIHNIVDQGNAGSGSAMLVQGFVCDGNARAAGGQGTFIVENSTGISKNNIAINGCGSVMNTVASAGIITELNDTSYGVYGFYVGETQGAATQLGGTRNNLYMYPGTSPTVHCTPSGAASNCDGVHQGGSVFIRQSAALTNWWDYNGFFGMAGSGDAGASSAGTPALLPNATLGGIPSYVEFPTSAVNSISNSVMTFSGLNVTCSTCNFQAGGENSVQVGDYLSDQTQASKAYSQVTGVTSATVLTVASTSGMVSGDSFGVFKSYTNQAGKTYGTDWGTHDPHIFPQFTDSTRTITTWDTSLGGAGTTASVGQNVMKLNGFDINGAAATYNASYSVFNALSYVRVGFTPHAAGIRGGGCPCDSSPDLGAVAWQPIKHRSAIQ